MAIRERSGEICEHCIGENRSDRGSGKHPDSGSDGAAEEVGEDGFEAEEAEGLSAAHSHSHCLQEVNFAGAR